LSNSVGSIAVGMMAQAREHTMYIPETFRVEDRETLYDVIRANNFGVLTNQVEGRPVATHLPFLLEGDVLVAHMARANPQWRAFAECGEVLCVFQGPHAYVSPSWCVAEDALPTWNYVAVHIYGTPEIIEDAEAAYDDQMRLVAAQEAGFDEPWSLQGQDRKFVDGRIRSIVNLRIPIASIEGEFRLNQNRPEEDRVRVAEELTDSGNASAAACGAFMKARRAD
jgi:transcriptional regulator